MRFDGLDVESKGVGDGREGLGVAEMGATTPDTRRGEKGSRERRGNWRER